MTELPPSDSRVEGRWYARRWVGYAWRETWRLFRGHVVWTVLGVSGAALGIFFLTPLVLGPDSSEVVAEEILLATFAAVGSAVVVLVAVFAWELLMAPSAMERDAAASDAAEHEAIMHELEAERRAHAELRDRIDASKLRIELTDESGPITVIGSRQEVKQAFINAERQALTDPFEEAEGRRRGVASILGQSINYPFSNESRTNDEYVTEVRTYLTALDQRWLAALARAATDRAVAELSLVVHNRADVGFAGVEIQISLPDDFDAAWAEDELWEEDLPERPIMWGSYNALSFVGTGAHDFVQPPPSPAPGAIRRRDGRLLITWDPFGLPSGRLEPLTPVRLFVPDEYAGQELNVPWTAASVAGGMPVSGEVELSFASEPLPPEMLLLPEVSD